MLILLVIILLFILGLVVFLRQEKFGKLPSGERLRIIQEAPNYKNGSFQNINHTPDLTEGVSYWKVIIDFFFGKKDRVKPSGQIPSVKTNLLELDINADVLVWFGHSSYFIQVDGKRILVDPVFSGSASPLPGGTQAFKGSDIYSVDDLPEIDILFISHDHWDHLDHKTIKKLKARVKLVICGLGVGAHLEHWGYESSKIIEKNWNETIDLQLGFVINTVPARHFSGRGLSRNRSLWMAYVLSTPTMKIFIGGDSGYDDHFAEVGRNYGPFDLAILENGQYNDNWRYIHTLPNEILKVAKELNAKRILPVHSSKFMLASHAWDEPLELVATNGEKEGLNIITPMIGEPVWLKEPDQTFSRWWQSIN